MMQFHLAISASLVLLAFVSIRHLYAGWRRRQTARQLGCKPVNKYPHYLPWGIDLLRTRFKAIREGRYRMLCLEQFQEYGPTWLENTMAGPVINTMEPENARAVKSAMFHHWNKHAHRKHSPFLGSGIFSQDGEDWKRSNALVMPLFQKAELSDVERFTTYADRLFPLLPDDGSTVDLQPLFAKLVGPSPVYFVRFKNANLEVLAASQFLDSATEFILGQSMDLLLGESAESTEFIAAFDEALKGSTKRNILANGQLKFLFKFDKSWEENYTKVHAFIDRNVELAMARINSKTGEKSGGEGKSKRGRYVLADEMAKVIPDPVALRFQLLNIFMPARDGTAILMSNTIFYLARNPSIWAELHKQALALRDSDKPLTLQTLKSLTYFRYTLQETLRIQGPYVGMRNTANRDTTLPRGGGLDGSAPVFVPKGTKISLCTLPGFEDPKVWGDDVRTFRPGRFEGKALGYDFYPFAIGPRICPGQEQVYIQATYLLVRMAQKYRAIENRDPCLEYVEAVRALAESKNGVKVGLIPTESKASKHS